MPQLRPSRRSHLWGFVVFQVIFVSLQVFIFYPCWQGAPGSTIFRVFRAYPKTPGNQGNAHYTGDSAPLEHLEQQGQETGRETPLKQQHKSQKQRLDAYRGYAEQLQQHQRQHDEEQQGQQQQQRQHDEEQHGQQQRQHEEQQRQYEEQQRQRQQQQQRQYEEQQRQQQQPPQNTGTTPKSQANKNSDQEQSQKLGTVQYEPNWASLDSRPVPEWYDNAKVGIFIHWGVFSVPSYVGTGTKGLAEWFWFYWKNEEYVRPVDSERQHRFAAFLQKKFGAIKSVKDYVEKMYPPKMHYTDFASKFRAELFDPNHWAEVFKESGAKYVILTSKHHEGYTLWPSKKSWNWNAEDIGPHRDLVGDLGAAVRKAGLKYGLYYSLYEWFNPTYNSDKLSGFKTQHYIKDKMMPELVDLVKSYKPDIVWSDGHFEAPCDYWNCTQFLTWLYNESPVKDTVLTNDRWGTDVVCKHGDFLTCKDRYNPGKKQTRKWENCMTIDHESWGYRRNAVLKDYYTMEGLLLLLAQTVSYGGNLLMNIGPTADGRIQPIFEERLRQMGSWLKVNGEGIYGTHMWHTPKDPLIENVYYTAKQPKDEAYGAIYAIVLKWPETDHLKLTTPTPTTHTEVTWLGYNGDAILWKKEADNGMVLDLPKVSVAALPCQWAWIFKITKLENM